jgi:MFS family permease
MANKLSADHVELSEPAFLQLDRELSIWNLLQKHRRALLICASLSTRYRFHQSLAYRSTGSVSFTSGILFGYDTVANSAGISMPAFILYFGEVDASGSLYLPSLWTSLWTSMSALAQALSATAAGVLVDRFGRKYTGMTGGIVSLAGAAVQYTAQRRSSLLGGKIVNGLGIGLVMATGATYASEVVPPRLVPAIQKALVVFILFMQGLALVIIRVLVPNVAEHAFRVVFAIQFAVAGLVIIAYVLGPE